MRNEITTIIDPYKAPEQTLEALQQAKDKMLQQQEAMQQRIKTGEERITTSLHAFIASLKNSKMAEEDITANAFEFAMQAYCELHHLPTDPIPTRIRLKAAQTLEQVYLEIGRQEGREGMLTLLQTEIDQPDLWTKLQWLCQQASDGVYRADWGKFYKDTGGYTINSLASYNLLDKIDMYLDYKNKDTYHIKIKEAGNAQ